MKRIVGILLIVLLLYGLILTSDENARRLPNHQNLAKRVALYGVLTLGVGFLILAGGIDLSMGSVFCLAGVLLGLLLNSSPDNSALIFYLLCSATASGYVAVKVHDRLRDRLRALFSVPLALLAWPLAPLALAALLFRPLRVRVFGGSRGPRFVSAVLIGLLALLAGSLIHVLPLALALLLREQHGWLAVLTVLVGGGLIGLFHGVLITRLRLQPFIVTLCGLFIWRGMAYWLALPDPVAPLRGLARFLTFGHAFADSPVNSGSAGTMVLKDLGERFPSLDALASGFPPRLDFLDIPPFNWFSLMPERFWLLLGLVAIGFVLLHLSVYGRYLFAVGANEQAARYAGIDTDRYKVFAYILCSTLAAFGGVLQMLELKSTQPSTTGLSYELYAITGAVLGGCSLRGGEGTVIGMLLGTAVLPLLNNLITLSGLPGDLEFLIIGLALLIGTILDELLKRRASRRKAMTN